MKSALRIIPAIGYYGAAKSILCLALALLAGCTTLVPGSHIAARGETSAWKINKLTTEN